MRGHKQSNTRQLNRHYQSGKKGRRVASFYMHCNFPYSATGRVDEILVNPPAEGVIQSIEIDRGNKYQTTGNVAAHESFNHLYHETQNKLYPLWEHLTTLSGCAGTPPGRIDTAYYSEYYGYKEYAYYRKLFYNQKKYKMINFYCGAFYGITGADNKIYSYFTYKDTRVRFYGPITFPPISYTGSDEFIATDSNWTDTVEYLNKINIWVPYPGQGFLFNPSSHYDISGPIHDSDGQFIGNVTYPRFPGVFRVDRFGAEYYGGNIKYKDYMAGKQIKVKVHLPENYNLSQFATSPSYVREWDPDFHHFTTIPLQGGDYCKNIFIDGPAISPSVPSEWYDRRFRAFESIGELVPIRDIDNTLTIEENMKRYAETIT